MKNKSNTIFSIAAIFIGIILVSPGTLKAQNNNSSDVHHGEIGARFLPTFTSFQLRDKDNGLVEGRFTFGYGVGALLAFNFTEHVGIQGEVLYSSLAQKYKEQGIDRNIKLRYINIPLLFSVNTGKSRVVNLNGVVGPQIGISVGSDINTSDGDGNEPDTLQAVLAVKKGDLGIAYGAGLDFGLNPARTVRLGIGFRGVYGFIDISDDSKSKTTDEYYLLDRTHIKTYSGYIGLSYLF